MTPKITTDAGALPELLPTLLSRGASSFLLGAFAPEIKEDLSFGDTELGAILTFGYLVSA